jgi:hypothetical protein
MDLLGRRALASSRGVFGSIPQHMQQDASASVLKLRTKPNSRRGRMQGSWEAQRHLTGDIGQAMIETEHGSRCVMALAPDTAAVNSEEGQEAGQSMQLVRVGLRRSTVEVAAAMAQQHSRVEDCAAAAASQGSMRKEPSAQLPIHVRCCSVCSRCSNGSSAGSSGSSTEACQHGCLGCSLGGLKGIVAPCRSRAGASWTQYTGCAVVRSSCRQLDVMAALLPR